MTRKLHSGQALPLVSNGLASVQGFRESAAFRTRLHTNQVSENHEK
jgi:hypothetical protein